MQSRPRLALEPDDMTLFLSQCGEPISRDHLSGMVHDYVGSANVGKVETRTCYVTRWQP